MGKNAATSSLCRRDLVFSIDGDHVNLHVVPLFLTSNIFLCRWFFRSPFPVEVARNDFLA